MRKVFWCCTAAAILAAGSVYLAAKHIDRNPYETMASLIGGGAATGSCPATAGDGGIPADPTPADLSPQSAVPLPPQDVVVRTDGKLAGEIAVDEGSSPMASSREYAVKECTVVGGEEMPAECTATIDMGSLIGSATSSAQTPCPPVMPYCPDDAAADRRMPYADEEQCEEPAEDSLSWLEMVWQAMYATAEAVEATPVMSETDGEETQPYRCPEDEYHRQHSQYCPYTGRCYEPSYVPSPAVPDPAEKKDEDGANKIEDEAPKTKGSNEEQALPPPLTDLDTMEFRPSDAGFDRLIPDPL